MNKATADVDWYYSLRHKADDVKAILNNDISAAYKQLGPLADSSNSNEGLTSAKVARAMSEYRALVRMDANGV